MGERISDEYLQIYLEQLESLRKRNPGEWMHEAPWRMALEEIRERRAQDLSAFEEIVLQSHLTRIADDPLVDRAVIRLLDKLLTRGNR